jgi:nicotinamide-nucleotide amidase
MKNTLRLKRDVRKLSRLLAKRGDKLVLAESCTGGLLASLFTEVPGASGYFCGSHVVYREDSKRRWLGVSPSVLKKHSAVSREVASAMARGALKKTLEANLAASVTGYLGPSGEKIGLVYFAVARRGSREVRVFKLQITRQKGPGESARLQRRIFAAEAVIRVLIGPISRRKG